MVGVYDGVSDLKNHLSRAPFDLHSLTRGPAAQLPTALVRGTEG
ncbi:hypothetical protein BTZ20_5256 [Rhodococcus sp. MTM3W5.2]|nr:hypothetical protein BTZ20_5256 [Rhodococcus sp. MTM3W5.2]